MDADTGGETSDEQAEVSGPSPLPPADDNEAGGERVHRRSEHPCEHHRLPVTEETGTARVDDVLHDREAGTRGDPGEERDGFISYVDADGNELGRLELNGAGLVAIKPASGSAEYEEPGFVKAELYVQSFDLHPY